MCFDVKCFTLQNLTDSELFTAVAIGTTCLKNVKPQNTFFFFFLNKRFRKLSHS